MNKKPPKQIIDSRHLKVLVVKKNELKDSIVFVCLDEKKYGHYDVAQIRELAEYIERIEPSGCYIVGVKKLRVNIFDRAEIKNRDIIITVGHGGELGIDESEVENRFKQAFSDAKNINFVHNYAEIE